MASNDYFSGRGRLFMATRDGSGQNGPLEFLGDVSDFSVGGGQEFLDFNESISGFDTRVLHLATGTNNTYSMTMRAFTAKNMARVMQGTVMNGAGTAGTVTGELHQAYNNSTFPLRYTNVSTVVVSAGGTTLVAGTDYTVNPIAGSVTILPGSTAIAGTGPTQVSVSYAYAAGAGGTIQALKGGIQEYVLYAELTSRTNGRAYTFLAPRVTVDLASDIVLLGGDVGSLETGGAILPATEIPENGPVSQYYTITVGA